MMTTKDQPTAWQHESNSFLKIFHICDGAANDQEQLLDLLASS